MVDKLIDRVLTDKATLAKIRSLIVCTKCQKEDFRCLSLDSLCHKGVYCAQCLSQATCSCKEQNSSNEELMKILHEVPIKCTYWQKGCSEQLPYDKLMEHESYCRNGKKLCPSKQMGDNQSYAGDQDLESLRLFKFHSANKESNSIHADYSVYSDNILYASMEITKKSQTWKENVTTYKISACIASKTILLKNSP